MGAEAITLISVALNALAAFFAPLVARRMASQQKKLKKVEDNLNVLGAGIRIIEKAVEENKDSPSQTGAGNRVVQTIRNYGPAAKQLVDTARSVAGTLRTEAVAAHEAEAIRGEQ